jgi:cell division protein FtsW (lipid II flippase)
VSLAPGDALRRWLRELKQSTRVDLPLLGALLLLSAVGLVVLYSASGGNAAQVGNQALGSPSASA